MKKMMFFVMMMLGCVMNLFAQSPSEVYILKLSSKALSKRDGNAAYELGMIYFEGRLTSQNYAKAVQYFTMAVGNGNVDALNALGYCYYAGVGVGKNYNKAFEYFQKGMQQGDNSSAILYNIGECYEFGRGTPQNLSVAIDFYKKAAAKGSEIAQDKLTGLSNQNNTTITFLSSTSSSSRYYTLRAGIKSSSQIADVYVSVNNTRGISSVASDGYDFTLNKDLELNYGSNTITVSVTNKAGKTTSKSLTVYVFQPSTPPTEKRVALVIGNANYRNAPLKTPINDANDIAERLRTFGFDVTLKTNLTLNEFKNALNNFKYKANNSDVALFYYAGHGMEVNQTNFLFPVDIESFCDGNGVDASLNVLNAVSGATQKIIIIDACRNNPCRSIPGFKRMSAQNSFIAYSTSEGKLASDVGKNGRNSPYAEALLNALKWNSSMTLSQLFQRVNNTIFTGQAPIFINSLVNDFVFNK